MVICAKTKNTDRLCPYVSVYTLSSFFTQVNMNTDCVDIDNVYMYYFIQINMIQDPMLAMYMSVQHYACYGTVRTTRPETCDIFAQRYQFQPITTKFQKHC